MVKLSKGLSTLCGWPLQGNLKFWGQYLQSISTIYTTTIINIFFFNDLFFNWNLLYITPKTRQYWVTYSGVSNSKISNFLGNPLNCSSQGRLRRVPLLENWKIKAKLLYLTFSFQVAVLHKTFASFST